MPICLNCFDLKINESNKPEHLPVCVKCDNLIEGTCLRIDNQPMHRDCFKCFNCNVGLSVESGYYKDLNDNPICLNCSLAHASSKCDRCLEAIEATEQITFLDKKFHRSCYSCEKCGVDLVRMKKTMTDRETKGVYCEGCFIKGFAPKCHKCHQPIAGPHQPGTKYEDKNFHRQCFTCARCRKTLADKKFFRAGNILICEACY